MNTTLQIAFIAIATHMALYAEATPPKLTWENIEISTADAKQTKSLHVVDLGFLPISATPAPQFTPASVPEDASCRTLGSLNIGYGSDVNIEIALTLNKIKAASVQLMLIGAKTELSPATVSGLSNGSLELKEGVANKIGLVFHPAIGNRYELSGLMIMQNGRPVTTVILKYVFMPGSQSFQTSSGMVPSGSGDQFSTTMLVDGRGYTLVLGEAPLPYTLAKACHWLRGDRRCGSWSTCDWTNVSDGEVSLTFRLQGHKESSSSATSEAFLQADYILKPQTLTLK